MTTTAAQTCTCREEWRRNRDDHVAWGDGPHDWTKYGLHHGPTCHLYVSRKEEADALNEAARLKAELAEAVRVVEEGVEAIRLTREYVGEDTLPEIEGWSHFDFTQSARAFLDRIREGE